MLDVKIDASDACGVQVAPSSTSSSEECKVSFPKVDGPTAFYDDSEHVAWVAVPFDKVMDPNFVLASLDRAKFDCLNYLGAYLQDRARRQALASKTTVKPGILAKLGIS